MVYLTHSLIPPASCADLGVGDEKVASVHLSTPLVTDYRQVHGLQYVVVTRAWKSLSLRLLLFCSIPSTTPTNVFVELFVV